ncbi:hypothetical protein Vretimale_3541 [Volvox reticuliferus]|uniref:Uncharacterized protein n=1 Tax=Volvox reticuliferus TaxID=1737510 RepID=A0A8J4G4S7_9CHLO|nr:hypothetical protein Vretifemale_1129 [Volvox reticuliferus]GIL98083.1 hypothetical protein Vretimale_3541 [Volvox reticuliferus]
MESPSLQLGLFQRVLLCGAGPYVVLTPSGADIKSLVRDTLLGSAAERHPELISLVDTMITSARLSCAESTWRLYDPIICKWADFCNRSGSNPLSAPCCCSFPYRGASRCRKEHDQTTSRRSG